MIACRTLVARCCPTSSTRLAQTPWATELGVTPRMLLRVPRFGGQSTMSRPSAPRSDQQEESDQGRAVPHHLQSQKPHHKYTLPNAITVTRILATPYISYLIVDQQYDAATVGFVLAGLSDWLDGFIAKHFNQRTVLGSFLDPIADKVFVTLVSAACCSCNIMPAELFGVMMARDVVLVGGAFYLRAKTKSETADFFDTNPDSDATFEVHPDAVGKINTVLQFSLLGSTLLNEAFMLGWHEQIETLWWIVGTTTIVSGVRYGLAFLRDGGAYKGLTPKKRRQASKS